MLGRLRKLHPLTHGAMLVALILFVWLNLDYTRNAYNDHVGIAWRGGMRCGFPLSCWDSGQASLVGVVNERMNLRIVNYGGVQWAALAVNVLVFGMALLGVAWSAEVLRARVTVAKESVPRTYRRMHAASYAAALSMSALLLWVNARFEIEQFERNGKPDFRQTYGWPLDVYSANAPKDAVYAHAASLSMGMVEYLEAHPRAWYKRAGWNTQNVTWNLLICVGLVMGTAVVSEVIVARRGGVGPVS